MGSSSARHRSWPPTCSCSALRPGPWAGSGRRSPVIWLDSAFTQENPRFPRPEVGLSYGVCEADHTMRSARANTFRLGLLASAMLSVLTVSAQEPPPAGQRGRGGDPFAGQQRVNALVISGGGFHDYS